jgi:hypothetical protein
VAACARGRNLAATPEKKMKAGKFALATVVAAAALGFGTPASAQTFSFGDFLTGTQVPTGGATWASMSISNTSGNTYTFSLSLGSNFDDIFGSQAYVNEAFFNASGFLSVGAPTLLDNSGVSSISSVNGNNNGPTGIFEFGDRFGQNANNRLSAGETVSWSQTFASALTLISPEVGLKVQGIGERGQDSATYTPTTPIPEPETYAMLLAGLGLLVFARRRAARRSAAPA